MEQSAPTRDPHAGQRRPALLYLLAIVVPVVLVRGCLLETYVVRGASMAPTFVGDGEDADRLAVLKRGLAGAPRRWDVLVLDSGFDKQLADAAGASLKRVAATGGELLLLRDGDVWIQRGLDEDGSRRLAIARKPDALVRALLVPMVRTRGLGPPWQWEGASGRNGSEGTWRCGPGEAAFEAVVTSGTPSDPSPFAVGDVALEAELDVEPGTIVRITLREGVDVFEVRLAGAADGGATLFHNFAGAVVARAEAFGGLAGRVHVLAWNVDNGLRVFVDDVLVLSYDYEVNTPQQPGVPARNGPRLGFERGRGEVLGTSVMRDLHYTNEGTYATDERSGLAPFRVPPGHVFVLGDHAVRSRDSRHFGPVAETAIRGRAVAIYGPGSRRRLVARGEAP